MTYDLKFTLQRQLQVFTEMIQRRFFLVFLRSTSHYYTCQLFLSQMLEIFTLLWTRFPETSHRLPKISDEFTKTSERCQNLNVCRLFPKTFKNFRSYLKDDTFSVLWYDFVRTQKRTQSHHVLRTICPDLWVRREKLSLMRGIDDFSPLAGVRLTHNAYTIFWWYEFWLA